MKDFIFCFIVGILLATIITFFSFCFVRLSNQSKIYNENLKKIEILENEVDSLRNEYYNILY